MIDYASIGQKVKKIRLSKGVTQEELAEKVGVGVTHISHLETGTSTTLGKPLTAKLLCTAIESGSFKLNDQSLDNFKKLFARIESYTG